MITPFSLVVEQNNYATKTVNADIIYDLNNWPKVPLRNFTSKNCLFYVTNVTKHTDKEKWVYSGYGTASDGKVELSFCNGFTRNVLILCVDNISLSHTDNLKHYFLVLG